MTVFLGVMLGLATGALASATWILADQMLDKHRMRRLCQRVGHIAPNQQYGPCIRCDRWFQPGLVPHVNFHRGTQQPLPTTDEMISDRLDAILKNVVADAVRSATRSRPW